MQRCPRRWRRHSTRTIEERSAIRLQLEKHRNVQAWADCHVKINRHGYTLEAYDPIGQRRNAYPNGTAIDTTRDANCLFTFFCEAMRSKSASR